MKVPIETDDDELKNEPQQEEETSSSEVSADASAQTEETEHSNDTATADGAAAATAEAPIETAGEPAAEAADAMDDLDEEAMVAEAIRRGEEAAEADFQAAADKARRERDEMATKLDEARQEAEKAKADASEVQDRLARLQADWENYRRRTATERLAEQARATEGLVTKLVPVIDDFDRALAHAGDAEDVSESFTQFVDGVSAVRTKLLDVLAREGVEVINPADEPFDPLSAQAVGRVEDHEAYEDTVRDVYQPGYRMGGKVIRTAMVTVTYGGPRRPAPDAEASVEETGEKSPEAEKAQE